MRVFESPVLFREVAANILGSCGSSAPEKRHNETEAFSYLTYQKVKNNMCI